MSFSVRPAREGDFDDWLEIWNGYLAYYKTDLATGVTQSTFQRCVNPDGDLNCLVAEQKDGVIGFVIFHYHASTWDERPICYLEDLSTAEASRGKGVARALIEGVAAQATEDGCCKVYWHTDETNYFGRLLYDKVAQNSGRIHYQRVLAS